MVRPKDLADLGIPSVVLTRLAADGRIERVGRGLYRVPGRMPTETESLELLAIKAPRAVFCLLTALQVHELTTQLPRQVWIAMPRGSHAPRIDYPPIKMVQMTGAVYTAGIEEHLRDGVTLRVYSAAKTVAEAEAFAFNYDLATPPPVAEVGLSMFTRFIDDPSQAEAILAQVATDAEAAFNE